MIDGVTVVVVATAAVLDHVSSFAFNVHVYLVPCVRPVALHETELPLSDAQVPARVPGDCVRV